MTDLEKRLIAVLYRVTCPDARELGEYRLGMVSSTRQAFIEQHLDECPHCSRELTQLDAFMTQVEPDLAYSTAERIKIWVASRVPDLTSGAAAPAFAFRGEDDSEAEKDRSLVFEADDAQLMVEIHDDPSKPGRKAIIGLIVGIDPAGLEAYLWQEGRLVATTNADDLGNFTFSNLGSARYELILAGPGAEIHVQELLT